MSETDEAIFSSMLANPDLYKKNSKQFKMAISLGDVKTMKMAVEIIQNSLNPSDKIAMIYLNSVRFIKETIDKEDGAQNFYTQLVAEKLLPEIATCAQFARERKEEDRGKFFFSEKPSNDIAILGNSFFRLVLECILVWGGWFPNSAFSEQLKNLQDLGVTFPSVLNYFKDEHKQPSGGHIESNQGAINSSMKNTQEKGHASNQNMTASGQKLIPIRSSLTGVNLDEIKRSEDFTALLVKILGVFQKVKEGVRDNLASGGLNLEQFNQSIADIRQFSHDFKILIEKGLSLEATAQLEVQLSALFNESEFADTFLADITAYKQKVIHFEEIRKKYTLNIKGNSSTPSGNNLPEVPKAVEVVSTSNKIVEKNQEGQNHDPKSDTNVKNLNQGSAHKVADDDIIKCSSDEDEEEEQKDNHQHHNHHHHHNQHHSPVKQSQQQIEVVSKVNNISESQPPEIPQAAFPASQQRKLSQIKDNPVTQNNSNSVSNVSSIRINGQIDQSGKSNLGKKQQSSFRDILESQDMDSKYKVELRCGSSYRKVSASPNQNQSSFQSSYLKSEILKKSIVYPSDEVSKLKKQLGDLMKERDNWKDKYDFIALQLKQMRGNININK